ncbi:MAG: exodeoxyribonuclease VII large subunit [Chlamydiales bacterium]
MSSTSTLFTVSTLTFAIKNQLESRFHDISIQGEISNFKRHSSGHLYFDLKDKEAKIGAVLFKNNQWPLSRSPKEGDEVIVTGDVTVYPPHGKYQMVIKKLEFAGIGALLAQLEERKRLLKERGWFAQKRALPPFPKRIGVITSATGAVIRDIIHVLERRLKGFHLILNPVRVQGENAAMEIAQAIVQCNRYKLADVLIVGRGGGSLEDLWPFNEEIVAKAIFESTIPIVSAVGHETDVTIADFVADIRAPTPSAAAEIISGETESYLIHLGKLRQNLTYTLRHLIERAKSRLSYFSRHPLFTSPYAVLSLPMQKLDEAKLLLDKEIQKKLLKNKIRLHEIQRHILAHNPTARFFLYRERLSSYRRRLSESGSLHLRRKKEQLVHLTKQLKGLDPRNVLKRGYSILLAQKENSVIVSTTQLAQQKKIIAVLSDGRANLVVDDS